MDEHAKRTLLRRIPYGLYVVGTGRAPHVDAFTGSWLTQTSLTPPLVSIGVREDAITFGLMRACGAFSINFLDKGARERLRHFARAAPEGHTRLDDTPWSAAVTGAPILEEAIGWLDCSIERIVEGLGDHAIVIARVVEAGVRSDVEPIVMADTPWHYGG